MTAMKSPPYNACCLGRWLFWLRSYAQAVPVTRPPSLTPCSSRARRGSWLAVKAPGLLTAREAGAAATAAAGGLIAELASHAQGFVLFWRRGAGTAQPCRREQSTALCVRRLLCRRRVYCARCARRAGRPRATQSILRGGSASGISLSGESFAPSAPVPLAYRSTAGTLALNCVARGTGLASGPTLHAPTHGSQQTSIRMSLAGNVSMPRQ